MGPRGPSGPPGKPGDDVSTPGESNKWPPHLKGPREGVLGSDTEAPSA